LGPQPRLWHSQLAHLDCRPRKQRRLRLARVCAVVHCEHTDLWREQWKDKRSSALHTRPQHDHTTAAHSHGHSTQQRHTTGSAAPAPAPPRPRGCRRRRSCGVQRGTLWCSPGLRLCVCV
jgi:hypothetical protein